MAEAVYILCMLTSAMIAALLLRGYFRTRERLLLWTGLGFLWLCFSNIMVVVDLLVVPATDLRLWRGVPTLIGGASVLFGLIWERE